MDATIAPARRRLRLPSTRWRVLAAVAMMVAAALALGVLVDRGGPSSGSRDAVPVDEASALSAAAPASSAEAGVSMPEAAAASSAAAEVAGAATAAAEPGAPPPDGGLSLAPRIAQNGSLTLRVAPSGLDDAIGKVGVLADQAGGYVSSTNAQLGGADGRGRAEVEIRVPRDHFSSTIEKLAALGTVLDRGVTSEDLTQDYVDTDSRLRHSRLVEARLVSLLDSAKTVNETLAVQDRLNNVQLQIETDKGRLDHLSHVTDYSTITTQLVTGKAAAAAVVAKKPSRPWGLRHAVQDAAHNLADTVGVGIRGLGVLLPILVVAALGWVVYRLSTRRRRRAERSVPTSTPTPTT